MKVIADLHIYSK